MRRGLATAVTATVVGLAGLAGAGQAAAHPPGHERSDGFDIQAHRGGIGLTVESTLDAFARAMELGVRTLEMDIQITEDGRDVVTHDRKIDPDKCVDTAPVRPGDPEFPYAGKYVKNLTFAQVRTLDCGSRRHPDYPDQKLSPGAKMPTLAEVFDLARQHHAWGIHFNIETKVEAAAPEETAPREQFVRRAAREVTRSGFVRNVTIQSFDWGALMLMRDVAPWLDTVALTEPGFLEVGRPGASPWLGGLDIDDFDGSVVRAATSIGVSAISPVHGNPQGGSVDDPGYEPFTTRALVREAHRAGLKVIPWTVNDTATMRKLIEDGVDGIITDYPNRLRDVAAEHGFELPRKYPAWR